ncbi:MAG: hypothetical protein ACHQAU_01085 [Gammaproteobacteria bacterium]
MGGMVDKNPIIKWHDEPEAQDYPAAKNYLTLIIKPSEAKAAVTKLKTAKVMEFAAKDIFRATRLSLLGISNSHVKKDRAKIVAHEKLSPLLLYRDKRNGRVVIADGYHRLCAVYSVDEDAVIPCKIV